MDPFARVPLAWCNLVHDKRRCAVCVAGVGCAIVLMFMQLGFWYSLLDSSVALLHQLDADVFVMSKARYYLAIRERFPVHRIEQARAVPGVALAYPLYLEPYGILWRDPEGGPLRYEAGDASARPIRVIAFNPAYPAVRDPEVRRQLALLHVPGNVLLDRRSKAAYGERAAPRQREAAGIAIEVVGTFSLGTDFTCDGTLITSDETYAELIPYQPVSSGSPLRMADVGLIKVAAGADPDEVKKQLQAQLPDDVTVLTFAEVVRLEQFFWQMTTPIGLIFTFGLVMGFLVGFVICFQILSADVADHLKEYATLKAIGYRARYLDGVILTEALWLTVLAYGPALLLTAVLYELLGGWTGLPLTLTLPRSAAVFALTAVMCTLSGLGALQKLRTADPAEVFQ